MRPFNPFFKHKIIECHHTIIIPIAAAVEIAPQNLKKLKTQANAADIVNHPAAISCL